MANASSSSSDSQAPQPQPRDGDNDDHDPPPTLIVSPWPATWRQFNQALRDPRQDFNPFVWIARLFVALSRHVFVVSGCHGFLVRHGWHERWRPLVPYAGLGLVSLVLLAYATSLRYTLAPRWCPCGVGNETNACASISTCAWMRFHDVVVAYLIGMIFFHYLATVFTSPGVVLPKDDGAANPQWKALHAQGGMYGIDPVCDVSREQALVALYGPLEPTTTTTNNKNQQQTSSTIYFPSPHPTYCQKCRLWRPSRCHHCSTCQRCVLQFDHHCLWVNQCIGYHNYRHFCLMVAFLMLACWYGVALLFYAFYEPFRQHIRQHGLQWLYSNGTGLLDLPWPNVILGHLLRGDMPPKMVIDLVYPFLLGMGAVLSWFLGFHFKYILLGHTTLEHSICLEEQIHQIRHGSTITTATTTTATKNPFDQGYRRNLYQVFGPSVLALFLPVFVQVPPPYMPQRDKSQ